MNLEKVKLEFQKFLATPDGQAVLIAAMPTPHKYNQEHVDKVSDAMMLAWIKAHTCLMQRMERGARKVNGAKLSKYYDEGDE